MVRTAAHSQRYSNKKKHGIKKTVHNCNIPFIGFFIDILVIIICDITNINWNLGIQKTPIRVIEGDSIKCNDLFETELYSIYFSIICYLSLCLIRNQLGFPSCSSRFLRGFPFLSLSIKRFFLSSRQLKQK